MSAHYDFWKKPGYKPDDEVIEYTPRVVSKGVIRTKSMIRFIHQSSTLQEGEVEAALDALIQQTITHLKDGYTVELGKLGYFSLKLKSRPVTDKKSIHAQSVSVDTVKYRPSAWMKKQFISTPLQRAPVGFQQSKCGSREHRKGLLEKYLDTHPFISRKEYGRLTGLLKTKALTELNGFVGEGWLMRYGSRNHLVFMKK